MGMLNGFSLESSRSVQAAYPSRGLRVRVAGSASYRFQWVLDVSETQCQAVGAGYDQGFQEEGVHSCVYVHVPPLLCSRLCE